MRLFLLLAVLLGSVPGPAWETPVLAAKTPAAPRKAPVNLTIVTVEDGVDPVAAARELGVTPVYTYTSVIRGFAANLPAAAVSSARRSTEKWNLAPDAPLRSDAQRVPTGVERIDAIPGRQPRRNGSESVHAAVAVLDTGVANHRDLNVKTGKACIGKNATSDKDGHGTHVAGTIAAKDNDKFVVGVAPGAQIWAVKVLDAEGEGSRASVLCGLDWVYKNKATIDAVNLSLSGPGQNGACAAEPLHKAICRVVAAGIPVVVAAGNGQEDASRVVPAAWPEVITVSAFGDSDGRPGGLGPITCNGDPDDSFAFFSNYGEAVDVAAPGECILSLKPNGGLRTFSGTSQAAPHVTGAVARFKATHPGASVATVRKWLLTVASRPQDSPYGFSGDRDVYPERVLYLGS